jgi:REP element-mobilizing transposase RayT
MGLRGRSRFAAAGHVLFVTTTAANFAHVFSCGSTYYNILIESLEFVLNEHQAVLFAYVLMPNHVHLVLRLPEGQSISDLMRDFKKYTSTKIRQELEKNRRVTYLSVLRRNAMGRKAQVFKLWMDRFDDVVIEDDETQATIVDYVHCNPVKAGLVEKAEEWIYSSAADYLMIRKGPLGVCTNWYCA